MIRSFTFATLMALALMGFVSAPATAEDNPEKLVLKISEDVMAAVRKERENFKDNPQALKDELLKLLDPVTDFESFSKGVMGQYYKQATEEQRAQFMADFKQTLVDLYTKALVAFEVKDMTPHETVFRNPKSARVVMKVTSPEDAVYFVQYSMRKNDDDNWQVRNVVLDGVNLGLTYRNQFMSAMDTENQDLVKVINGWAAAMQNQEPVTPDTE